MTKLTTHKLLTYFIASVWLINGLVCKVLNFVPRHEQIVANILGEEYSRTLIILIGIAEIVMAIWIVIEFKSRLNATLQILVIASMNVMEFFLTPDLLLWGRLNTVFAILFMGLIYYKEFILNQSQKGELKN